VIVSVPVRSFSQANEAQFYVSMSRGRCGMLIFTADQLAQYPELERLDYDRSFDQLRGAAPLRSMPLVLLSCDHSIQKALEPLIADGKMPPGIPADFGSTVDQA
jgi:hypothetical protein